jgi:hypothetical protein
MALAYQPKGKHNIGGPKTRPTASSRLSFHRAGPRCPTSVYVHDSGGGGGGGDDDDDDDEEEEEEERFGLQFIVHPLHLSYLIHSHLFVHL